MDTEADRQVVLVVGRPGAAEPGSTLRTQGRINEGNRGFHLLVEDVHAHVEVLADIPLSA